MASRKSRARQLPHAMADRPRPSIDTEPIAKQSEGAIQFTFQLLHGRTGQDSYNFAAIANISERSQKVLDPREICLCFAHLL